MEEQSSSATPESQPPSKSAVWLPAEGERPAGWYVSFGGPVGKLTASLRVGAEEMDPDEITRLLGCSPTKCHRRGDLYPGTIHKRKASIWLLDSSLPGTASLNKHIAHLLGSVTVDPVAWKAIKKYNCDIFCGLFMSASNQGDVLSPEHAGMLASRGIALHLDIYGR